MTPDVEIKALKEKEQEPQNWLTWYYCCPPRNASGVFFCGIALIVIGCVWLFNTLGLLSVGLDILWPLLFIGCGLFWLIRFSQKRA